MNSRNIPPLIHVIIISTLICLTQYYGPLSNYSFKNSITKLAVQLVLFGYIVQMSSIVHELGHAFFFGGQSEIYIPDVFYIPYIGYMDISGSTSPDNDPSLRKNYLRGAMAGFVSQIIYLVVMGLIFFKGSSLAISIILSGMIIYMFSYIVYLKGGDFAEMVWALNHE